MDEAQGSGPQTAAYPMTAEISERLRVVLSVAEDVARAIRDEAETESRRRVQSASDEAAEIIADARRRADALVEDRVRRISELSDALTVGAESLVGGVTHAQEVRGQFDELIAALARVAGELTSEIVSPEPADAPEPTEESEPADAPARRERRFARTPEAQPAPEAEAEPAPPAEPADAADANGGSTPRGGNGAERGPGEEHLAARLVAFQMAVAGGSRGEVGGHLQRAFELDPPDWILDDIFGPGTGPETRVSWAEAAGQPAQS